MSTSAQTSSETASLLEASDVRARYGAIEALHGVSIEVAPGEVVAIVGANGAGKSTLMKTLIGVLPAATGTVVFDGRDVTRASTKKRVRHGLSLVPEGRQVFPTLTVENNLMLGAFSHGRAVYRRRDELAESVFDLFPLLKERRRQIAGSLSGGQQQMLAIGRALMADPKLLLVDELSLGLAPVLVAEIYKQLLGAVRERSLSACIVEQEVALALKIATRAYVMASGRIVLSGPAAELRGDARVEHLYLRGEVGQS
jgi:branched-chain amino acid transport system ATP-binding protein